MHVFTVPYLIPFLISAMLSFALAFYAMNFFRVPGAIPFSFMTLIQSLWTASMILGIVSTSFNEKQFWDSVQWIMVFLVSCAVYWFTQSILPAKRVPQVPWWLLLSMPTIFMLVLLTNPKLIYLDERIVTGLEFSVHDFTFSWLDWLAFVQVYAVLYYCVFVLWMERRRTFGQLRRKLTWALSGIFIQSVIYLLLFLTGVTILGQKDTSPFTSLIGNLLMGWGLFRNRIFEIGSMARSQVVENMADAFIVTDAQGRIVDMNYIAQSFASSGRTTGLFTEVFSEWLNDIKLNPLDPNFTHDFVRVIEGIPRSLELRAEPLTDSQNDIVGRLIVVRDITARKMLESALAASEERYRSIIESMAEGVVLLDDVGQILMCNQAAETILGRTYDQIEGQNVRVMTQDAVHEDLTPIIPEKLPMYTTLQTGEAVRDVVIGIKRSDEAIRWLLINIQPFIFTDQDLKETRQVVISFRDLTEMRRMQAEATRAEIAQDRARLLAQFIQSASHEFRTPLAVIGTSLYMVSHQSDPAKRQHHVEVAEQEIKRIDRLLETLVNMVQLDSGAPLKRVPTNIQTLVQAVVLQYEKRARNHQISLQFNACDSLPITDVEPNYLSIGIKQVLDNAIRYTPDGGTVMVDVTTKQDMLIIKIMDNGTGIAAEELEHIFDRFWRHDTAHSTPGFGLGLSIAQKVFERHDGSIQIESQEGSGTTVTMKLALHPSTVGAKSDSPV